MNIVTTTLLLTVLWYAPKRPINKIDSFFGDLSYPTFLMHWQTGIFVAYVSGYRFKGWRVFIIATLLVTILSVIEAKMISGPLERLRKKIKTGLNRSTVRDPKES